MVKVEAKVKVEVEEKVEMKLESIIAVLLT